MMSFKIIQPGYENLTGDFSGIEFVNGECSGPLDMDDAMRIGALVAFREVMCDGSTRVVSPSSDFFNQRGSGIIPNANYYLTNERNEVITYEQQQAQFAAEQKESIEMEVDAILSEEPKVDQNPGNLPIYTREQLEAIADQQGIAGLREIADKYNVKSNSISGLVDQLAGLTV